MNHFRSLGLLALALAPAFCRADDTVFDRLEESLTFATEDASWRGKFSGLLDLEAYHFTQPAPGLLFSGNHNLINPRLTLFFDAQLGSHFYVFAQARLDRGFDPAEAPAEVRLDEYAVRWTPWDDGRFNVQVGKFATVVGNWAARHQSWDNPFINAPLVYETVTPIYDAEAPSSPQVFLEGITEAKYDYNPILWGPGYATGIAVSGVLGEVDYAFELKNSPPASRPSSWGPEKVDFDHPTVEGRIGWRPNVAWNLGLSGSEGAYFVDSVEHELPTGRGMNDFKQFVLGQDVSYAWHHWQLWAEFYEARFQVPRVGNADVFGWYVEVKRKLSTQLSTAIRWNQQVYDTVTDGAGGQKKWGHDLWRLDAALAWRLSTRTQLKFQWSLQHEDQAKRAFGQLLGMQVTVRF